MDDSSPSELKKVLKDSYVIWAKDSGKRRYVTTVYSTSVSTTADIDDAMKVPDLETAEALKRLAESFNGSSEYHISRVQVIVEDYIPGVSTF